MKKPFYELVWEDGGNKCIIRDIANNLNFAFITASGHGHKSSDIDLAKKVIEYLNSNAH